MAAVCVTSTTLPHCNAVISETVQNKTTVPVIHKQKVTNTLQNC